MDLLNIKNQAGPAQDPWPPKPKPSRPGPGPVNAGILQSKAQRVYQRPRDKPQSLDTV